MYEDINERLEIATSKAENASGIMHEVANGAEGAYVTTESGQVPTIPEFLKQLNDEINTGADSILADATQAKEDAEGFRDETEQFLIQTGNIAQEVSDNKDITDQNVITVNDQTQIVTDKAQQVSDDADQVAQDKQDVQDIANTIGRYQGLWPDTGGSALKGDTYQTQVGGIPTGQYFTALQDTSVDPIGDDVNWRLINSATTISTKTRESAQDFIDSFALKIFQSPTDSGLTEIQTRTVNANEVYEVRKTSDDSLATIFSDTDGTTEVVQNGTDNVSGGDGVVAFYISDGDYYITVSSLHRNFITENYSIDTSIWGDRYVGTFARGFTYTSDTDVGRDQDGRYYSYIGDDEYPVAVVAGTVAENFNELYNKISPTPIEDRFLIENLGAREGMDASDVLKKALSHGHKHITSALNEIRLSKVIYIPSDVTIDFRKTKVGYTGYYDVYSEVGETVPERSIGIFNARGVLGTYTTEADDIEEGDTVITVADASGFAVGDYVEITLPYPRKLGWQVAEILSITDNKIQLNYTFGYSVAGATVTKIDSMIKNVTIKLGEVVDLNTETSSEFRMVSGVGAKYAKNLTVSINSITNGAFPAIITRQCQTITVVKSRCYNPRVTSAGKGYNIQLNNSNDFTVNNLKSHGARHTFDSSGSSNGEVNYAEDYNSASSSYVSHAQYDHDIKFYKCKDSGGSYSFTAGFTADFGATFKRFVIDSCEFVNCIVAHAGEDCTIKDTVIENAGSYDNQLGEYGWKIINSTVAPYVRVHDYAVPSGKPEPKMPIQISDKSYLPRLHVAVDSIELIVDNSEIGILGGLTTNNRLKSATFRNNATLRGVYNLWPIYCYDFFKLVDSTMILRSAGGGATSCHVGHLDVLNSTITKEDEVLGFRVDFHCDVANFSAKIENNADVRIRNADEVNLHRVTSANSTIKSLSIMDMDGGTITATGVNIQFRLWETVTNSTFVASANVFKAGSDVSMVSGNVSIPTDLNDTNLLL